MASMTSYESNINKVNESAGDRVFMFVNASVLVLITIAILLPLIFIVSASFSSSEAVIAGKVTLWPVDFSLQGYQTIFEHKKGLGRLRQFPDSTRFSAQYSTC